MRRSRRGRHFASTRRQTAQLKTSVHSAVQYDLIGKLAEETKLTRATVGAILQANQAFCFRAVPSKP